MSLKERLKQFRKSEGLKEGGRGKMNEQERVDYERRRRILKDNLEPITEELLKPVLEEVNEGWLEGQGKVKGPYIKNGGKHLSRARVEMSLRKKLGLKEELGGDEFVLRLSVDSYEMVRLSGKDEEMIWDSVEVNDEEFGEKLRERIYWMVTETGACV